MSCTSVCTSFMRYFFCVKVKATEREKQEEERSQTQNEDNRHATRHQVHDHSIIIIQYVLGFYKFNRLFISVFVDHTVCTYVPICLEQYFT